MNHKTKSLSAVETISRRDLLKGLGIAALGAAAANLSIGRSLAQVQPTQQDLAAYYRFRLGEAEMIVISDAAFAFPPNFFGPEEEATALFESLFPLNPDGTVNVSVLNLVMLQGDTVAIFDTGNGAGVGKLVPTLESLGIGTDQVTDIVMSHWHGDHINGLSTDGVLVYPNAQVRFPQAEYDFLQSAPADVVGAAVGKLQPALDAGQVVFYEADGEVMPGITSIATPGHTPGHSGFRIASGDSQLIHFVDSVVSAYASVRNPQWAFSFDADQTQAVESRQMILGMAAADRVPVFGYHFSFPGTGYVSEEGEGFNFTPYAF